MAFLQNRNWVFICKNLPPESPSKGHYFPSKRDNKAILQHNNLTTVKEHYQWNS